MRKGLYRLFLTDLGECARTSRLAGDAAPFLDRATYELLGFQPQFDCLPLKDDYLKRFPSLGKAEPRIEALWSAGSPVEAGGPAS